MIIPTVLEKELNDLDEKAIEKNRDYLEDLAKNAARNNDLALIRVLAKKNVIQGKHLVDFCYKPEIAAYLLEEFKNSLTQAEKDHALCEAVFCGHDDLVDQLLKEGAKFASKLHQLAYEGNLSQEEIQKLTHKELSVKDAKSASPFLYACASKGDGSKMLDAFYKKFPEKFSFHSLTHELEIDADKNGIVHWAYASGRTNSAMWIEKMRARQWGYGKKYSEGRNHNEFCSPAFFNSQKNDYRYHALRNEKHEFLKKLNSPETDKQIQAELATSRSIKKDEATQIFEAEQKIHLKTSISQHAFAYGTVKQFNKMKQQIQLRTSISSEIEIAALFGDAKKMNQVIKTMREAKQYEEKTIEATIDAALFLAAAAGNLNVIRDVANKLVYFQYYSKDGKPSPTTIEVYDEGKVVQACSLLEVAVKFGHFTLVNLILEKEKTFRLKSHLAHNHCLLGAFEKIIDIAKETRLTHGINLKAENYLKIIETLYKNNAKPDFKSNPKLEGELIFNLVKLMRIGNPTAGKVLEYVVVKPELKNQPIESKGEDEAKIRVNNFLAYVATTNWPIRGVGIFKGAFGNALTIAYSDNNKAKTNVVPYYLGAAYEQVKKILESDRPDKYQEAEKCMKLIIAAGAKHSHKDRKKIVQEAYDNILDPNKYLERFGNKSDEVKLERKR